MKYAQIIAEIEQAIGDGALAPGDRLPSERELAAAHGVSRMTVRQALQALESRGVLRRSIGRSGGSFVARPKLERDLGTFSGLSEQLRRQGVAAGARVVSAREIDGVVEIVRVRLADGEPFALERSSFPADRFRSLLELDLTGSLYDLLRMKYGLAPASGRETIGAVNADYRLAELLRVPIAAALLATARNTCTESGVALEYTIRHARGDFAVFSVELNDAKNALMGQ